MQARLSPACGKPKAPRGTETQGNRSKGGGVSKVGRRGCGRARRHLDQSEAEGLALMLPPPEGRSVDPPSSDPSCPAGEDCELDTEAGRCVPGVCRNGGTCTNAPNGGFRCQCPAGGAFEGPRCEVAARSFPPSSFVMFRGLRQRFHLTLSLS